MKLNFERNANFCRIPYAALCFFIVFMFIVIQNLQIDQSKFFENESFKSNFIEEHKNIKNLQLTEKKNPQNVVKNKLNEKQKQEKKLQKWLHQQKIAMIYEKQKRENIYKKEKFEKKHKKKQRPENNLQQKEKFENIYEKQKRENTYKKEKFEKINEKQKRENIYKKEKFEKINEKQKQYLWSVTFSDYSLADVRAASNDAEGEYFAALNSFFEINDGYISLLLHSITIAADENNGVVVTYNVDPKLESTLSHPRFIQNLVPHIAMQPGLSQLF